MASKKKEASVKPSEKEKKFGVFDIISNINEGARGTNLMKDCAADVSENVKSEMEKLYLPFIVNRNFSNFQDTVLLANTLNQYPFLPNKMQYDFLRNIIRPRKRFSKWGKAADDSGDISVLVKLYQYSSQKARDALSILSEDQMIVLRKRADPGGK